MNWWLWIKFIIGSIILFALRFFITWSFVTIRLAIRFSNTATIVLWFRKWFICYEIPCCCLCRSIFRIHANFIIILQFCFFLICHCTIICKIKDIISCSMNNIISCFCKRHNKNLEERKSVTKQVTILIDPKTKNAAKQNV